MSARDATKRPHIGGQAVIEGVMMRSPTHIATAVRNTDGEVVIKSEAYTSLTRRYRILNIPIIRGAVVLYETFVIAVKALSFSADQATEKERKEKRKDKQESRSHIMISVLVALVLGFTFFFYIPLKLTEWIGLEGGFAFNLVDGLFRLMFIFCYILLLTRWKEMERIFEYHGAEHKTIFAYEEEGVVTPEIVSKYPTVHPRCSTSFLVLVVIVSIVLFIILGRPTSVADRIVRFSFIPVIGGVSYELLKVSAISTFKRFTAVLVWPGLFLQRFTTKEPSLEQIEVAIAAFKACLNDKVLDS